MNNNKRNIVLFGAGAVIDWGGPSTNELTEIILKSGFETKKREKITSVIKSTLENKRVNVNFETILSVIEELIIYYSGTKEEDIYLGEYFLSPFFEERELLSSFLNYSLIGNPDNYYRLDIPNYKSLSTKDAPPRKNPNQFFFELLLVSLHTHIGARISKYNFYTKNKKDIVENPTKQDLNDSFADWIKSFLEKKYILRLYTLNYDRLAKVILENRGIKVFEGFNSEAILPYKEGIPPNLNKILIDSDCLCNYNLHGCINWELAILNNHKHYLPTLKVGEKLALNYPDFPNFEIEPGKPSIYTNVIAGYQKAQRSLLSPYKQMQASFDRDCFLADNLIIVGYSFSDEHINECIRMAFLYNSKIKIHIIDCGFKNNLERKYFFEFLKLKSNQMLQNINDNVTSIGNTFVYNYTFKDFLSKKIELVNG